MTNTTKRIPHSECIQGTCMNITTGCWGECSIRAAFPLNNVACGDPVTQPRVSEQAGERIAQYVPGEWFDARTLDEMQAFYLSRLPAIRAAAEEHGYAIGLHGSTRRDFDLMAMQWRKDASDKDTLAHAIAAAACGITREGAYEWEQKPNGRFAVSMPICWTDHGNPEFGDKPSLGHIDLSVIEQQKDSFAVKFIEQRADEYLRDHASTEHDTGATIWHYGEAGLEYHSSLIELADDLRAAITQQAAPEAPTAPALLSVGTMAWALIAENGNIIFWEQDRRKVEDVRARYNKGEIVPVVGACPVAAPEVIILCPTKDEVIVAAESWGAVDVDPLLVKRAALGPVGLLAAPRANKAGKDQP